MKSAQLALKFKIIFFLLILVGFFFFQAPTVRADYGQALDEYNSKYSNYRQAYSNFTVARSTYVTYKTFTAQSAAVVAFRDVLDARNKLINAYFDLLSEKLNITSGLDPVDLRTFTGTRKSTKEWLIKNQAKVSSAASIEDLNNASDEFTDRYEKINQDMKQTIGLILLAKGTNLDQNLSLAFVQTSQVSSLLKGFGEDTTAIDRGLIQAKVKRDLFAQKQQEEKDLFFPKYQGRDVDILRGQQLAIAANQYLREATSYLIELTRPYTGE